MSLGRDATTRLFFSEPVAQTRGQLAGVVVGEPFTTRRGDSVEEAQVLRNGDPLIGEQVMDLADSRAEHLGIGLDAKMSEEANIPG